MYIQVVAHCHLQSSQEVRPSAAPWLPALKVSPCLYFQYLNICIDTHLFSNIFSKIFALQQADLSALSNPSSSTYSLLCEIAWMLAVAHHHPQPLQEVHSTSSTCISFQPRSVTVCLKRYAPVIAGIWGREGGVGGGRWRLIQIKKIGWIPMFVC